MAFALRITGVEHMADMTIVSGRLTEGRYFGPEDVEVVLPDGTVFASSVGATSATTPQAWPILPEHDTVLQLELAGSPLPKRIPVGATLVGIGLDARPPAGRRPSDDFMELPVFWALHYYLLSTDGEHDESELCEELFGISDSAVNQFYLEHFTSNGEPKPWPYFQIRLPNASFVEVEFADGAEYQTRFKIGDDEGAITLAYASGHFSFPALRWAELVQILAAIPARESRARCCLLLFPGIYLQTEEKKAAFAQLSDALASLGLFQSSNHRKLLTNVIENRWVQCNWRQDERLGWINDGEYSQRNPSSLLSNLKEQDFRRINAFFAALG
jgi:hypothetical protein